MKIDFYISSLSGGGAEKVLIILAEMFAKKGYDVMIHSLEKREQFYQVSNLVKINKVKKFKNGFFGIFNDFKFINSSLKKRKADIVISFLLRTNILVLFCSFFRKVKVIVCDRNNPKTEHSLIVFFLVQFLYRKAKTIVVQTQKIKRMYFNFILDKIMVIENPVDFESLNSQLEFEKVGNIKTLNRIISIGRLEKQKDFKTLIAAFGLIKNQFPEWELDIYGIGEKKKELEEYIYNLPDENNQIKLCGRTKKPFYEMKRSKIFVLSSFYEGFPNALCEAMYAKLVCISSDCISGPSELINNNENGYLFEVGNIKELSILLKETILNYEKLNSMKEKAYKRILVLDKEKIFNKWEKLVISLIKETENGKDINRS